MYPVYFATVSTRAEVYSPLQNTAVWLAAWLYGHEPSDALVGAMTELHGRNSYQGEPLAHLLHDVRASTDLTSPGPAVRLILSGPGQPPELPAGSAAALAATELSGGSAIVLRGNGSVSHVLVPDSSSDLGVSGESAGVSWRWFEEDGALPEPAWLSPGEADALLSRATNDASFLIEAAGGTREELPDPRLAVGTLADFYDTPGLPMRTPPRAAKLFARADAVAAVIETVVDRLNDHSFDPQLFSLWRHIRTARMAGVADAVLEYQR